MTGDYEVAGGVSPNLDSDGSTEDLGLLTTYQTLFDIAAGTGKGFIFFWWYIHFAAGASTVFTVRVTLTDDTGATYAAEASGGGSSSVAKAGGNPAWMVILGTSSDLVGIPRIVQGRRITNVKIEAKANTAAFTPVARDRALERVAVSV